MESTNNTIPITRPCGSWTLQEQDINNSENPISAARTLQENLSRSVYTTTFTQEWIRKESTWKEDARNLKQQTLFCNTTMTIPHPWPRLKMNKHTFKSLREPFKKTFKVFISQWKLFDLCWKTWSLSCLLRKMCLSLYRNQFITIFAKTVESSDKKNMLKLK